MCVREYLFWPETQLNINYVWMKKGFVKSQKKKRRVVVWLTFVTLHPHLISPQPLATSHQLPHHNRKNPKKKTQQRSTVKKYPESPIMSSSLTLHFGCQKRRTRRKKDKTRREKKHKKWNRKTEKRAANP
jgi:hypothetical protein